QTQRKVNAIGNEAAILSTPTGQAVTTASAGARAYLAGKPISPEAVGYIRQVEFALTHQNRTIREAATALAQQTRTLSGVVETVNRVKQELANIQARQRNGS
ncbi:MAG TPA: hypothetical protein VKA67_04530, partial [Verrucomicrobiae bacterium]|nr:hypothetical protein [Verrucomicrobiae bacterium]